MITPQNPPPPPKKEIVQTQKDIKAMNKAINQLEIDANDAKAQMHAIHDVLVKVQGDSLSKLKYSKKSKQTAFFIGGGVNQMFWYDDSQQKYMEVKDVSINNNSIQKQLHSPWFMVIGDVKSALFCVSDKSVRDKWVKFIKDSLEQTQ